METKNFETLNEFLKEVQGTENGEALLNADTYVLVGKSKKLEKGFTLINATPEETATLVYRLLTDVHRTYKKDIGRASRAIVLAMILTALDDIAEEDGLSKAEFADEVMNVWLNGCDKTLN